MSIDLKEISEIENIFKIKGDFTELECQNKIKKYFNDKVDVILSDMAVNTSGNKYLDSNSTGELCISAIKFSRNIFSLFFILVDNYLVKKFVYFHDHKNHILYRYLDHKSPY